MGPCWWVTQPPFLCPQDLKPGNLAVNEDCELKVCVGSGLRLLPHLPICLPSPQFWRKAGSGPGPGRGTSHEAVAKQLMARCTLGRHLMGVALGTLPYLLEVRVGGVP